MHHDPQSDKFYQQMSAKISALPAEAQHDAVFALFGVGLRMLDRPEILAMREDLLVRFPQNPDKRDMGTVLIEIVDGHLALRDLSEESDSEE